MAKKYYGWILFGVFIVVVVSLLSMNPDLIKIGQPDVTTPSGNLNSRSEKSSSSDSVDNDKTAIEIDMENSDVDFEADISDFESDLENMDDFDENIDLESIDDEELL